MTNGLPSLDELTNIFALMKMGFLHLWLCNTFVSKYRNIFTSIVSCIIFLRDKNSRSITFTWTD